MKFQSRYRNAKYLVRPYSKVFYPGLGAKPIPCLMAEFTGIDRIFDSEASQKANRWTDDERKWVERHLLEHKDFGHGLYLAPGETVSEEYMEFMPPESLPPARRCVHFDVVDNKIDQCSAEAGVGRDYCSEHDPENQSLIKKGMLTAKD